MEVQEKQIQITNLNIRVVSPKPGGKVFDAFSVYEVTGNDGIKYETFNAEWYNARTMGEQLTIKYEVVSNTGNNGTVYTNYKLVIDVQAAVQAPAVNNTPAPVITSAQPLSTQDTVKILRHLYSRVVLVEANILKALGVKPPVKEEVKEEVPVIQVEEETQIPSNEIKAIPSEEENLPPEGLPF